MIDEGIIQEQKKLCKKHNVNFCEAALDLKVGIAMNAKEGILPLNGLRHPAEGETTGWYIWAGEEFSEDPDFFKPLHVRHLRDWCPTVQKYLGLPPGWRFLLGKDYEDVWPDDSLLEI